MVLLCEELGEAMEDRTSGPGVAQGVVGVVLDAKPTGNLTEAHRGSKGQERQGVAVHVSAKDPCVEAKDVELLC